MLMRTDQTGGSSDFLDVCRQTVVIRKIGNVNTTLTITLIASGQEWTVSRRLVGQKAIKTDVMGAFQRLQVDRRRFD